MDDFSLLRWRQRKTNIGIKKTMGFVLLEHKEIRLLEIKKVAALCSLLEESNLPKLDATEVHIPNFLDFKDFIVQPTRVDNPATSNNWATVKDIYHGYPGQPHSDS
ncbi:hypothetical protein ACJX0J_030456, partial [Zea mays]